MRAAGFAEWVIVSNERPDTRGTLALAPPGFAVESARVDRDTFAETGRELAEVVVMTPGGPVTLLSAHACRPTSARDYAKQRAELRALGEWLKAGPRRVALGDLNATPWCAPMRALRRDGATSFGDGSLFAAGTWPTPVPGALAIPIDQIVAGSGVRIASRVVGPNLGGDHRPVVVELRAE